MTQRFCALALVPFMFACANFSKQGKDFYGQSFDTSRAVPAAQMLAATPIASKQPATVKGTIVSSCKTEGCWMKLDAGDGRELFVSTEEKFYLPIEGMIGKTAYVSGETWVDTTTVDELRHRAEDAGKTESEIMRINEPQMETSVVASGVLIR